MLRGIITAIIVLWSQFALAPIQASIRLFFHLALQNSF
jgi:hypothetical protein